MNKNIRFTNFLIDYSIITFLSILIGLIGFMDYFPFIYLFVFFFYYFLFEAYTNKTPGKIITKTEVVDRSENRPLKYRIFFRTLLRLTHFDIFSYVFGAEQGIHDTLSGTKLVLNQPDEDRQLKSTFKSFS